MQLTLEGCGDIRLARPQSYCRQPPFRTFPGSGTFRSVSPSLITRFPMADLRGGMATVDELERLLKLPYYLSPGWLRIDPTFDPLRQHPRFVKLVGRTAE
jgi:hypothetical protein